MSYEINILVPCDGLIYHLVREKTAGVRNAKGVSQEIKRKLHHIKETILQYLLASGIAISFTASS
jgi:hypothetical protein